MRDYGAVHSSFWTSNTTRSLSNDGRHLALYLLTSPHSTIAGVFRLPKGYISDDIQWDVRRVEEALLELSVNEFLKYCETTNWVWVCKHFEWNKPQNENQFKSAKKIALLIPEKCSWRQEFLDNCGKLLGIKQLSNGKETLSEGLGKGSETVPQGFRIQEQEQNQEQDHDQDQNQEPSAFAESDPDGSPPRGTPKKLLELWNETCTTLPKALALSDERSSKARTRFREHPDFAWWHKVFDRMNRTEFFRGQNDRGWKGSFDWVIANGENALRVLEGKYDGTRRKPATESEKIAANLAVIDAYANRNRERENVSGGHEEAFDSSPEPGHEFGEDRGIQVDSW